MARPKARKVIQNDDPDSPESFGLKQQLDSPVARIAATNGFVKVTKNIGIGEERWVKQLSNGKEAWLRTQSTHDFSMPMNFRTGEGGREWELVVFTKKPSKQYKHTWQYTDAKQLIRTNETAMTYVLGAMIQRLATWPENLPKDFNESVPVPDPDAPVTAINSLIQSKTPKHPNYQKLAEFILANRENVYTSGRVTRHSSRYVHEHSTTFEMEIDGPSEIVTEEIGRLVDTVQAEISEEIVRINKKIYRALEREWDHLNSDEELDLRLADESEAQDYNALGGLWDENDDVDEPVFSYAELDAQGKANARDNYRNGNNFLYEWWDHVYDEWKAELEDMGFDDVDINFTGFYSQGDGASFTAKSFDFMKWAEWFMSNKPWEIGHPYTDELHQQQPPVTESVDDPDHQHMLHQGRPGECPELCQMCGAYCTLIHYDLNGTQMPKYHICQRCDSPITDAGLNNDQHVTESVDDPDTFMQSLDKTPDHEMIDTSNPAPSYSRSYNCACGQWSFGGLSRTPEETAAFEKQAKEEFQRHTQMTLPINRDAVDKLQARNWVTARRLKEEKYGFPDQGEQDKPEHWDSNEVDVDDPSTVIKQEVASRANVKSLQIVGRRWFRRGIGGTYCTASIYINDKLVHETPIQGGSGEHYLTLAKDWLLRNGYLAGLLDDPRDPLWTIRDKHPEVQLSYYAFDVKRERDL